MNKLMLIIDIWSVIQYYEKLWSSYDRKCSCWSMSVNFDESMWMWLWEYDWCVSQKYFFLKKQSNFFSVLYPLKVNTLGWLFTWCLTQTRVFMWEGWFLKINVLPLLALGPVHKNKCSDIVNSYIEDCLGWGC